MRFYFHIPRRRPRKTALGTVSFAKYARKQPLRTKSSAGRRKPEMSEGRYFLRKGSSCIADCACCCNVFQRLLKLGRYELNLWIFMHAFVYSSHYWNWIIQSPSAFCRTFQRGRGHLVQYYKKKKKMQSIHKSSMRQVFFIKCQQVKRQLCS